MKFDADEKLAVVKLIDSVIQADGEVHPGEIEELNFLMGRLDFDIKFLMEAQKIPHEKSLSVIKHMPKDKKVIIGEILIEMASADGFVHLKEISLITEICKTIGITLDID